jgi:hypothetical protein
VKHIPDKRNRRTSRRGGTSPIRPVVDWAGIEHTLERVERAFSSSPDESAAGEPLALHHSEAAGACLAEGASERPLREPTWTDLTLSLAAILRRTDPKNEILAGSYLRWYASILGPQVSIDILRDHFGPAILKQSLAKKRGPTAVRREDNHRIRVYVEAIMWVTGESMRDSCERLAKMGLRIRKDAASGRVWVGLDEGETIRKRCMSVALDDFIKFDTLKLLLTWHRAGDPPVENWLKRLIAQDSSGPN